MYAIAGYVEGKKATHEFGMRARGGFFNSADVSEYADAVLDAACSKLLVIQLARDIGGDQFVEVRQVRWQHKLEHAHRQRTAALSNLPRMCCCPFHVRPIVVVSSSN